MCVWEDDYQTLFLASPGLCFYHLMPGGCQIFDPFHTDFFMIDKVLRAEVALNPDFIS